jgi:hypothetical protein
MNFVEFMEFLARIADKISDYNRKSVIFYFNLIQRKILSIVAKIKFKIIYPKN